MTRGNSLEQDLRLLINNPKYSDIEILCGDKKKLHGCRAILAARSEVFNGLFYNGMKESYQNQISFPKINSTGLEIILEYTYAGSVKEESLTKDNIVEAFYAADYFQLPNLQNLIIKSVKNNLEENHMENYSPELLSKVVDTIPFSEDNILLNLLVKAVANIPLNTIEFSRLSIVALQYLLSYTHEKENPFATSEYEVFRYSAILAAKQVSNDAYKALMERLPTLEQIKDSVQVENKSISGRQIVAKELEPLIKFIDFNRIRGQILVSIIEPLEIIPNELLISAYRHKALSNNSDFDEFRGTAKFSLVWDESGCGSMLIIEDNGKVVRAQNHYGSLQCVRAKVMFENKGIFEWDVMIKESKGVRFEVGVCASEYFKYETCVGGEPAGWVLDSDGEFWNSITWEKYCPKFVDNSKITIHLDMYKRTLAFTVNGTKYPEVSGCDLPSELYPAVSLHHPCRIQFLN